MEMTRDGVKSKWNLIGGIQSRVKEWKKCFNIKMIQKGYM